ncbi:MAG: hypothetical protein K0B16_00905 [Burkholderiaceae bacterium]|nr:hypothetical protein [Burkholderiaceae bacterium]
MVTRADDPLNLLQNESNAISWRSEEELASSAFVADLYSARIIHWITKQGDQTSPAGEQAGFSNEAVVRSWFD